ncbi:MULTISPECIES: acetyl-CoA carboxylase biotin carboxylase subunit [unclassified Nocardiopsis]|uniref:acetyl-CoA carboxylase biotin carboxylase subunit n=1 Tax=Nocardiopsis TaxID=2013 RepID=UPI00387B0DC1
MNRTLTKVLIANRGEIAVRIARTCREMGIGTVAVHSVDDDESQVVRMADESVRIGPTPSKRSYLDIAAVVGAALQRGADAVHPGYGFLSEDPDFARVCVDEGLTFIGPPPGVLEQLGDKASARRIMSEAGLPLLPGTLDSVTDVEEAERLAGEIGYPLIVKAAAGGGGRGMRIAHRPADLRTAYLEARADAHAFFADGRVYMERYLDRARHVEVQVLCDAHGAAVHLGERDCSVQRRQQKLIEETPAPGLPDDLLERIRQAAITGARAAGYVGAGTFEFLAQDGEFYFMEVNSRIQVEHAVTEMVTDIDLVREQIQVARGAPLAQELLDVRPRGVSLECRVNAEDPKRGFAPTPGLLEEFHPPGGPFVRVDTHMSAGSRISPAYDSLLAKVVVWAPDRDTAVLRMRRALEEFRISGKGVRTTIPFLLAVLARKEFAEAEHTTSLVDTM